MGINDFTKEELQGLKNIILQSREDYPAMLADKDLKITLNKIQSMLESCKEPCEHEFERKILQIDLCDRCKSFRFVFKGINNE